MRGMRFGALRYPLNNMTLEQREKLAKWVDNNKED